MNEGTLGARSGRTQSSEPPPPASHSLQRIAANRPDLLLLKVQASGMLDIGCRCYRLMVISVQMLLGRGGHTFASVLEKLRCAACGGKPARLHLYASMGSSPAA